MPIFTRIQQRLQSNPRIAKILHGGFSGILGKGMSLFVGIITLPLMVRYLGRVEYGLWVTISSTVIMLGVLDIGISSTLTNYIAKAHANDSPEMARGYYSSAFWITTGISIALAASTGTIWHLINWGRLLGVNDILLAHQAEICIRVSFYFFLVNLPLSLANKVLGGYQQVQIVNYFAMINSILGLVAITGGVAIHLSIVGLMIAYCCAMLTGTLLLHVWLFGINRPWIRPRFSAIQKNMVKDLFGEGILFFVLQISGLVVFNSDNLVITHFRGAGEVTPYSVAWRLMGYAYMLHGLLIPALWPAFSDAYHRKDLAWIQVTYKNVIRWTMGGIFALAIILALCGQWIIRIWATQAAVPSQNLLWAMAVWAIVVSITTNQACLLAATQRIGLQALASTIAAIVNLIASIYLVQLMGSIGAIIATLASYIVFIVAPQSWEVRRILRGDYMRNVDVT